jgi:hypothetical protein
MHPYRAIREIEHDAHCCDSGITFWISNCKSLYVLAAG